MKGREANSAEGAEVRGQASRFATPLQMWKFDVPEPTLAARAFIDAPVGAKFLSVAMQDGQMVVWALVAQGVSEMKRQRLIVANTGQPVSDFPKNASFLGTVQAEGGIVWHVWDAGPS